MAEAEALTKLADYLTSNGGSAGLIAKWTARVAPRPDAEGGRERRDGYWFSEAGVKFRSLAAVAEHFGLVEPGPGRKAASAAAKEAAREAAGELPPAWSKGEREYPSGMRVVYSGPGGQQAPSRPQAWQRYRAAKAAAKAAAAAVQQQQQPPKPKRSKVEAEPVVELAFAPTDIVWAKVVGYASWPAIVQQVPGRGETDFTVLFYGTNQTSYVAPGRLLHFDPNDPKCHAKQKKQEKEYRAAVAQATSALAAAVVEAEERRKHEEAKAQRLQRQRQARAKLEPEPAPATTDWVQCSACDKWRKLPAARASALPDHWTCAENPNARFRSCAVPQEPDEAQARAKSGGQQRRANQHTKRAEAPPPEPLRNPQPSEITRHGFAECGGLLPPRLCSDLSSLSFKGAEAISNCFQIAIGKGRLLDELQAAIRADAAVQDAALATFGTRRVAVKNAKILFAELGAHPQIPHADDHCNRVLFGVCHLLDGQAQTEAIPYAHDAPYPTGVQVQCEACDAWHHMPDALARRREHMVSGAITCARLGRACGGPCGAVTAPPSPPWDTEASGAGASGAGLLADVAMGDADSSGAAGAEAGPPPEMEGAAAEEASAEASEEASAEAGGSAMVTDAAEGGGGEAVGLGGEAGGAVVEAGVKAEMKAEPWAAGVDGVAAAVAEEVAAKAAAAIAARDDPFAADLCEAFAPLLWRPADVVNGMRPLGPPPSAGDAIVALPTMVHRGPGNYERPVERVVLFFSLAPDYDDERAADKDVGTYDSEAQIHAGWILYRAGAVVAQPKAVLDAYRALGWPLETFGKGGIVKWDGNEPTDKAKHRDKAAQRKRKPKEVHDAVGCDACDVCPIVGARHRKVPASEDIDLCGACFSALPDEDKAGYELVAAAKRKAKATAAAAAALPTPPAPAGASAEPTSAAEGPQAGARVEVLFEGGAWYGGTVQSARWPEYTIKYDDGDTLQGRLSLPWRFTLAAPAATPTPPPSAEAGAAPDTPPPPPHLPEACDDDEEEGALPLGPQSEPAVGSADGPGVGADHSPSGAAEASASDLSTAVSCATAAVDSQ